ncbi:hypothetical protein J0H58_02895 [bacterium]|nr:hypothetical protein [bacterium]
MSTFQPARPRYSLPFAGRDYQLLGTFGLIEAVEFALREHIGRVAVRVVDGMHSTDLAKLVAAVLTACDHKMTAQEAGNLIWERVGLTGEENDALRLHLYSFLAICLAPPGKREERAEAAGEMMGKLAASPGPTTGESASAS